MIHWLFEDIEKVEILPNDLIHTLEFHKIRSLLSSFCYGVETKQYCAQLLPTTNRKHIIKSLQAIEEVKAGFDNHDALPLSAFTPIDEALHLLSVDGSVLEAEQLLDIQITLGVFDDIHVYFSVEKKEIHPVLADVIADVYYDDTPLKAMQKVLDKGGNVNQAASPQLNKIRKAINSKNAELETCFKRVAQKYKTKNWLSDTEESMRNGRRVLSIPSEYKRQVRGIMHDESATGKTVFVEPEEVILINNEIFDLESAYRREVYRILKELCTTLRPYISEIKAYQRKLVIFDFIHAKAKLSLKLECESTIVKEGPRLSISNGRHPILLLKNREADKDVVPFDLQMKPPNKVLLISGPNAGGKSILMMAVGLIQVMIQSGLQVPCGSSSEFGIYHQILGDIGDQQSIEDDLSTYSSRLKNMHVFSKVSGKRSLVLMDEFGSGTDPKIGGAIAEAILQTLLKKGVFGVFTTHYSNLKIFAFKNRGIVNGAMLFDQKELKPTYQLRIGKPGSSFAFEIASNIGLDKSIMSYAKHKTGKNEKAVDELLVNLQTERKMLEDKIIQLEDEKSKLQKLIKSYEALHYDLNVRKKKMRLESKEKNLMEASMINKEVEKKIKEIREARSIEEMKKKASEFKRKKAELTSDIDRLNEEIYYDRKKEVGELKVGDYVRMVKGTTIGKVESLNRQKATLIVNGLRMVVHIKDLVPAKKPLTINRHKGVKMNMVENQKEYTKLDIRGLGKLDAMVQVEAFLDSALMHNALVLEIIHGKGSGTLRQLVHNKIKEYSAVREVKHAAEEQGGDGVTLVYF